MTSKPIASPTASSRVIELASAAIQHEAGAPKRMTMLRSTAETQPAPKRMTMLRVVESHDDQERT